jgi:hypothetical protein
VIGKQRHDFESRRGVVVVVATRGSAPLRASLTTIFETSPERVPCCGLEVPAHEREACGVAGWWSPRMRELVFSDSAVFMLSGGLVWLQQHRGVGSCKAATLFGAVLPASQLLFRQRFTPQVA